MNITDNSHPTEKLKSDTSRVNCLRGTRIQATHICTVIMDVTISQRWIMKSTRTRSTPTSTILNSLSIKLFPNQQLSSLKEHHLHHKREEPKSNTHQHLRAKTQCLSL